MAQSGPRVVVVGSSNTDMVIAGAALPKPGQTLSGGVFYTAAGGKGANQAVAAARCAGKGARVTFLGAFGDDDLGRAAIEGLLADGVDCRFAATIRGVRSGVALIFVDARGENMIAVAPGANDRLAPSHLARARSAIRSADVLLTQLETPLRTVARALSLARAAGVKTILNPAPAPAKSPPRSLLSRVDILTPNENEFEAITKTKLRGSSGRLAARRLARTLGEALVVTMGSRGAQVFSRDGEHFVVPAFRVRPVDTVGAGDAFSGALALGLAEKMGLRAAIGLASAVAGVSVTRRGAQPSLPTRREADALLR